MENKLNILVQSNDFYCPFCGVMLESLFYNNTDIEHITVYLISDNIGEENLKKVEELSKKYKRRIKIINGNPIGEMLKERGMPSYHGSNTAYYKLFASLYINDEIDRLLYLDSDLIIDGSLKELIDFDMDDNILAMAIDFVSENHKRNVGCSEKYYFNTGVILFDFTRWKRDKLTDKISDHIKNVHADYPIADQDILNIVLGESIACLDLKFNFYCPFLSEKNYNIMRISYGFEMFYSEDTVNQAMKQVCVYHCMPTLSSSRPWCRKSKHPVVEKWDKYLLQSPWKDFQKIDDNRSFMFKMQALLYSLLPKKLFAYVNSYVCAVLQNMRAKKSKLR